MAMAESQSGILAWASAIRFTLQNDPSKQLFNDQIQTHGFLFLDEYLDGILAGPKKDPIIELVKTPGRKRDAPKRTRAATAAATKMKNVVSLSLEDDNVDKENAVPVNNFHKTLLAAKSKLDEEPPARPPLSHAHNTRIVEPVDQPTHSHDAITIDDDQDEDEVFYETLASPPTQPEVQPPVDMRHLVPGRSEPNELSIIAEDDEAAERSRSSVQLSRPKAATPPPTIVEAPSVEGVSTPAHDNPPPASADVSMHDLDPPPTEAMDKVEAAQVIIATASTSTNTFHSIQLDSPEQSRPVPSTNVHAPIDALHDRNHTAPLPVQTRPSPAVAEMSDAMTAPLPSFPSSMETMDIEVPLRNSPSPPRAQTLTHKKSITQFPTLPDPSPPRKSMRMPREASTGFTLGSMPSNSNLTVTAGAPALGKRTSWLQKAREAKAMEGTAAARVSTLGAASGPSSTLHPSAAPPSSKRKSGEMLGGGSIPHALAAFAEEEADRKAKFAKVSEGDVGASKDKAKAKESETGEKQPPVERVASPPAPAPAPVEFPAMDVEDSTVPLADDQDRMIDRLKRTVEGLGARMGKSIGGAAAANALAEARAARLAAEMRVAERNKLDGPDFSSEVTTQSSTVAQTMSVDEVAVSTEKHVAATTTSKVATEAERRLSVSDLVSSFENKDKAEAAAPAPAKIFKAPPPAAPRVARPPSTAVAQAPGNESTSTTPPNSPPTRSQNFVLPSGPVFNKPPPVFVAPKPKPPPKPEPARETAFSFPPPTFSMPPAMSLGVPAKIPSPGSSSQQRGGALSAQSTFASVASDVIFDRDDDDDDVPAWVPTTQDTEYSMQAQTQERMNNFEDDDDSWPLEQKILGAPSTWTDGKDDSITWSTAPTESQRVDPSPGDGADGMEVDAEDDDDDMPGSEADRDIMLSESDLESLGIEAGKSTANTGDGPRSQSQMSMASTSSSQQSQMGLFGQATKFVSSVLGGGKKVKPEVKSLQRAAVAAKKQQEEKDKKAARMKEMENRRQLAIQRKAEEEKARALEEEKKIKEDGERRKREREEHTDKRPLKATIKKVDDDNTKKRKLAVEAEKQPESKKPPSKEKKEPTASRIAKPAPTAGNSTLKMGKPTPSAKTPHSALVSSTTYNASTATSSTVKTIPGTSDTKPNKPGPANLPPKGKGKAKAPSTQHPDDEISHPSNMVQSQMAARAKAQMDAAKQSEPIVPSESIVLPDIDSEYSDSEDEDRQKTFDPPNWAQSPELRQQLRQQSTVNPDDIFGAIRPLRMEELFRTRQSRFRARTSSANWTGNDRLTVEEEREYERRMGFR
ncbi:hypothetical protein PLICRDRAFT_27217 [Plicaturopsis crispa FD-325 SS-3]|nr:hypothetical protein PLICRDRAFT_27217 [Plicaturopsis crispa FD-325 SS-3]